MPTTRNDNAFAAMVRDLRARAKKSMGQVAREVGITTVYYSEIENAKKPPPIGGGKFDFNKLAASIGGDIDMLMAKAAESRSNVRLNLDFSNTSEDKRAIYMSLARRLQDDSLSTDEIQEIRKVLEKE